VIYLIKKLSSQILDPMVVILDIIDYETKIRIINRITSRINNIKGVIVHFFFKFKIVNTLLV